MSLGVVVMSGTLREEALVVKLWRRVSILEKAMNMLLFGEYVDIPEAEKKEISSRLMDYIQGRDEEFMDLDELEKIVQDKDTQEGD